MSASLWLSCGTGNPTAISPTRPPSGTSIIKVTEEGTLVSDGKVRGRAASIRELARRFIKFRDPASEDLVTIAHGDCPEDAAAPEMILKEEYGVRNVHTGFVGPILGAHTGPGVLGLFHLGTKR